MNPECKICGDSGTMMSTHPFDGAYVAVDCWCTDAHVDAEAAELNRKQAARAWYTLGYDDGFDGIPSFEGRWEDHNGQR